MSTTRYKITLEYNGQGYAGWQRQPNALSVQQVVEEAIGGFSNQDVSICAAGRTDAGVHARGQVFHVDLEPFSKPMDEFAVLKAINAYLRRHPVAIIDVQTIDEEFHARFSATNKLYAYRVINRPGDPAIESGSCCHIGKTLNIEAMREGAKHLLGHHNFSTFRASECQAKSPMRTLDRLDITEHPYDTCGGKEIIIEAEARSFLHHQIRNIVGTLSLVGHEKWHPKDVKTALEAKNRSAGGPTAPAEGLCLVRVDY
ncbi:MAG: tRNA pseudouridine(38-40) synthase TruA [Alphaproteobacteria bacterium]|nr:tRNA pseudouridine(38-40) synthase TruA [Alphaproteobacteria bacterium]